MLSTRIVINVGKTCMLRWQHVQGRRRVPGDNARPGARDASDRPAGDWELGLL